MVFNVSLSYYTFFRTFFTFFIIFEKNAVFNVLYSHFSRSLVRYIYVYMNLTTHMPLYPYLTVWYYFVVIFHQFGPLISGTLDPGRQAFPIPISKRSFRDESSTNLADKPDNYSLAIGYTWI